MFRGDLLKKLGGFDEQFFYHFEEVDLCRRVWNSGCPIVYAPEVTITHLGGQSVKRFPIRFALERQRGRYRYFHKHFGRNSVRRARYAALAWFGVRRIGYRLMSLVRPGDILRHRLDMYDAVMQWTTRLDPARFVEDGQEPHAEPHDVAQGT
jgi:GT2 family glycosyltransferase